MSGQAVGGTVCPAATSAEGPAAPAPSVPSLTLSVAAAALALASGAGLVWAGIARTPAYSSPRVIARGAQLYAAECASCHGDGLDGRTAQVSGIRAPPLGASGHAWQHSDAELRAIVARGIGAAVLPNEQPGMPAFAERLGRDETDAVLAYVKSRWPAGVSAYQATLNPNGGKGLAALLRDPAWAFPMQCSLPPPATGGP